MAQLIILAQCLAKVDKVAKAAKAAKAAVAAKAQPFVQQALVDKKR